MDGGIAGAVLAAVPGLIDLLSMSKSRARVIGIWHLSINVSALVLFAVSFGIGSVNSPGMVAPFVLSIIDVVFIFVSGWLGGEMVYVEGVAIEPVSGTKKSEEKEYKRAA